MTMYHLDEIGLVLFFVFIFLFAGCNIFKIENRRIVYRINKKALVFLGCIVILVAFNEIYTRYTRRIYTDSGCIENPDGETSKIPLQYLGEVQAYKEDEFYGDIEMMEKYTSWWQKRHDFNGFLGIEIADWNLDFDNHYYVVTYGRPATAIYYDTTIWYRYGYEDWAGYNAFIESNMEAPYQSGVVYIYEMDKIELATTEF